MTLRETIRQMIVDGVPALAGRVYEPGMADDAEPLPFAILTQGPGTTPLQWDAFTVGFDVFLHEAELTFQNLDTLEAAVRAALDTTVVEIGSRRFLLQVDGNTGGDQTISEREPTAIVRALHVTAFSLGWLKGDTYNRPQPVALRTWLAAVAPTLQLDPTTWNPTDDAPAVYWRFDQILDTTRTNYGSIVRAQVNGHVLAPNADSQSQFALYIAERLSLTGYIYLAADGGPMEILYARADVNANPFEVGQLQVQIEYQLLNSPSGAPKIKEATVAVHGVDAVATILLPIP